MPIGGFDQFVIDAFSDLVGVAADKDLFEAFASNGRVSLLLDGFDELDPSNESSIASSVERLARLYPEIRIVITARPDCGIQSSAMLDVVPIAKLTVQSLPEFFNKILNRDKELATRLIAATKASATIGELVSTPLLATLLTIVYRAHQRIPLDFSEFYEELFQILLVRHDRSKIAYERHRKTKLSDRQMQEIFEAFSFKSKAKNKSSMQLGEAQEFVRNAVTAVQLDCNEDAFLADIKKVTCLLSEEGGRIEFLHQSVQEFFAAKYVKSRPEAVAANFYTQLLDQEKWPQWQQEVRFLEQIDKYRACKYFLIPAIQRTLNYLESNEGVAPAVVLRKKVTDLLGVRQDVAQNPPRYYLSPLKRPQYYLLSVLDSRAYSFMFSTASWRTLFDGVTPNLRHSYTVMADQTDRGIALDKMLIATVSSLRTELDVYREFVRSSDASEGFVNI